MVLHRVDPNESPGGQCRGQTPGKADIPDFPMPAFQWGKSCIEVDFECTATLEGCEIKTIVFHLQLFVMNVLTVSYSHFK